MHVTTPLPLAKVRISGGFWRARIDNIAGQVIPYQWRALNDQIPDAEPSHAMENFRITAGDSHGKFYGLIFQDSDVGKWIEAASYSLIDTPNPALERIIDEAVDLIGRTQERDGYLGTYFRMTAPEKKWTDLAMGHEMYCGGHLIEGAVAYAAATGKRAFLDIMVRYADHLDRRFGRGPGKEIGYCGHPEIELALFKLHEATGEARYRDLARFFVDERGRHPEVLDNSKVIDWGGGGPALNRWHQKDYYLDHAPAREQVHAEGHSVRAMYLYSAMADQWRLTGDPSLGTALKRLWESATNRRMYVTGGLGSQATCERFTVDYDLPPDTAYAETCAAIGLVFWAWRMTEAEVDRKYADVLERALYNGALSGISLDGTRYFYVNPLAVVPEVARFRKDHEHVKTERVQWLGCACCPPNIARLVCSVGQFLYTTDETGVWVHQYASGTAELPIPGGAARFEQETEYPWNGEVLLRIAAADAGKPWSLRFRVPEYAENARASVNGTPVPCREGAAGYVELERVWKAGDELRISFALPPRVVRSHPRLREAAGLVAVQRGPLVYCAEEADNGKDLHLLSLRTDGPMEVEPAPGLPSGVRAIVASGFRRTETEGAPLYAADGEEAEECRIRLVPYFAWGNRGAGEMRVWLQDGGRRKV
jgi:DUF1680 family protein